MRLKIAGAIGSLVLAACTTGSASDASHFPDDAVSIVANADVAVGRSRLLVAVAESDGGRLGSPQDLVAVEVAPADRPEQRRRADGIFTWIIEGAFGLYRAEFDFNEPGTWVLTVIPESGVPLEPTLFSVGAETVAPAIGDPAPPVPTPTVRDAPLSQITTDPVPDPAFYRISLDEAVASGRRTVAVFSTPAFCRTATCGPLLEQVKAIAPSYPDVNFVHVEIYAGFDDPGFVPDGSHLAPAVTALGWNLPSEPWVFVIDGGGVITHRFEGVMGKEELEAALG